MDNTDQIPIQASIMNRLKMHNITINMDQSLDFVHGPGLTIDQEGMCYAMNNKILRFLSGPWEKWYDIKTAWHGERSLKDTRYT